LGDDLLVTEVMASLAGIIINLCKFMKMMWETNLEDKIEFRGDFKPVTLLLLLLLGGLLA